MRVKVRATGLYTYPDVAVRLRRTRVRRYFIDTLLNPRCYVDVLSPSTERYDSHRQVFLLSNDGVAGGTSPGARDEIRVEQYVKQPNGEWLLFEFLTLDSTVQLPSIACSLQLSEVYDRISFDPHQHARR
jgi:hypothetical protein